MSISIPDRVVVFDYGEVISTTPVDADREALVAIAAVDGAIDSDGFWRAYWEHRHDLDGGGLTTTEYWGRIGERVGADWDAATLQRLWAADFRGWLTVEPATLQLIEELRAGGTRLAVLSNAGRDYGSAFRYSPMGALFEQVFVSAELGLLKPAAAIYEAVCAELGIGTSQLVFIDNRSDNVEGALAVGATAHLFTDPVALRGFLDGLAA